MYTGDQRGIAMELLTVKETAEMLRVSTVTVRRYIASEKLAAVRVGRNLRVRRKAVEEMIRPEVLNIDPRFADKSDEWLLANHPFLKYAGVFEDREGKADIAENHDKYLAEAYADTHEEVAEDEEHYFGSGKPLDFDSPLWDLIGFIDDDGPTDMAVNHDRYLAEAYADLHEE
jgi:excisionase family DNA binding protein